MLPIEFLWALPSRNSSIYGDTVWFSAGSGHGVFPMGVLEFRVISDDNIMGQ